MRKQLMAALAIGTLASAARACGVGATACSEICAAATSIATSTNASSTFSSAALTAAEAALPADSNLAALGGQVLLAAVRIQNFSFAPQDLVIPVNAAVRWTNMDFAPHTVSSTETPAAFGSSTLNNTNTFNRTFTAIHTYPYQCNIHPFMTGSVSARGAGDANGDNSVNINDFAVLAGKFGGAGSFVDGDFNIDGTVNINDFAILAGNFGQAFTPARAAVPEPCVVMIGGLAALTLRRRR